MMKKYINGRNEKELNMKQRFFLYLAVLFTALNLEAMPPKNVATSINPQSSQQQVLSLSGQQSCIGDHLAFMGISMGINMKAMMSKLRDKGFYDTDHLYDEATMRGIFYKVQVHVGFMSENGHLKTIRVVDADTEYQKRVAQKRFEDLLNELKAVYGEGKYVSRESWESRYEITLDCGTIIIQMFDSDEMDASSGLYTVSVVFNNNKE